jgi:Protein of unknown function (DUF3592)
MRTGLRTIQPYSTAARFSHGLSLSRVSTAIQGDDMGDGPHSVKQISSGKELRGLSARRLFMCSLSGIAATLFGLVLFAKTELFVIHARTSQGVVQAVDSSNTSSLLHITLTYSDAAGIVHTEKTSSFLAVNSDSPSLAVGDKVPVVYDPAMPQHVEIDSFEGLWMLPSLVFGVGAFFLIGGLGLFLLVDFVSGRMPRNLVTNDGVSDEQQNDRLKLTVRERWAMAYVTVLALLCGIGGLVLCFH